MQSSRLIMARYLTLPVDFVRASTSPRVRHPVRSFRNLRQKTGDDHPPGTHRFADPAHVGSSVTRALALHRRLGPAPRPSAQAPMPTSAYSSQLRTDAGCGLHASRTLQLQPATFPTLTR